MTDEAKTDSSPGQTTATGSSAPANKDTSAVQGAPPTDAKTEKPAEAPKAAGTPTSTSKPKEKKTEAKKLHKKTTTKTPPPGPNRQGPSGAQGAVPPGQAPPPNYYSQPEQEYQKVYAGYPGSYNYYPKGNNDNLFAGLCYLFGWIVSLVVLLAVKPQSPWLRFHAIQAIGLHILITIAYMFFVFPCLGYAVMMALVIVNLIFAIRCFIGSDTRIPVIADLIEKNFI